KRLAPPAFGPPCLAAQEGRNLSERGTIGMFVCSQLGDRDVGQDLARREVQSLRDPVTGVPKFGDVCQPATRVDMMDARSAAPGVASRFRADASVRNQCRELFL